MYEIIITVFYLVSLAAVGTILAVNFLDARKYIKEQMAYKPYLKSSDFKMSWFCILLTVVLTVCPLLNTVFALALIVELEDFNESIIDTIDDIIAKVER